VVEKEVKSGPIVPIAISEEGDPPPPPPEEDKPADPAKQ